MLCQCTGGTQDAQFQFFCKEMKCSASFVSRIDYYNTLSCLNFLIKKLTALFFGIRNRILKPKKHISRSISVEWLKFQ